MVNFSGYHHSYKATVLVHAVAWHRWMRRMDGIARGRPESEGGPGPSLGGAVAFDLASTKPWTPELYECRGHPHEAAPGRTPRRSQHTEVTEVIRHCFA